MPDNVRVPIGPQPLIREAHPVGKLIACFYSVRGNGSLEYLAGNQLLFFGLTPDTCTEFCITAVIICTMYEQEVKKQRCYNSR